MAEPVERLTAALADRYRIERELGAGGMATVYLAEDLKHHRKVAVKQLRPELSALLGPERFLKEIEVTANLHHPHILPLFDSGQADGLLFYVMPYIEGESLRQQLAREKQLGVEVAIRIISQVASALDYAHRHGVLHRDIKPENIMLEEGNALIADFGIALVLQQAGGERLTETGLSLGTPHYMSPEQSMGDRALDGRSDLYSLACVLYEMLAGDPPFLGSSPQAIIARKALEPVPRLRPIRDTVPEAVEQVVLKALARTPADRYATPQAFAEALSAANASGPAALASARVAVAAMPTPRPPAKGYRVPLPFEVREREATGPGGLPFAGREGELARLEGFLDRALAGNGGVAFIAGEAGSGKTALVTEFCCRAEAAHEDVVVVSGHGNAYTGAGDPYLLFREVLSQLTGDVEDRCAAGSFSLDHATRLWNLMPTTVAALCEMGSDLLDTLASSRALASRVSLYASAVPEWAAWAERLYQRSEQQSAVVTPQAMFDQYVRVLKAVARTRPVVIVLDDLHWADDGSVHLLFHLARELTGSRILVLGLFRASEIAMGRNGQRHPMDTVVHELQRSAGEIQIRLGESDDRAFIEALVDAEPNALGPEFRDALFRVTQGDALFTVELLQGMRDDRMLVLDATGRWTAVPELDWDQLPARVEAVIAERVARVPDALQRALTVGSVEGERFTLEAVADVLGVPAAELLLGVGRELEKRHQLVRAHGIRHVNGRRLSVYRFRHILFQRYLYDRLDQIERAMLHDQVGRALETLHGEESDGIALALARHFDAACLPDKTAWYLFRAGEQAADANAFLQAMVHFESSLAALLTLPASAGRDRRELELQLGLGTARHLSGAPGQMEAFVRARELGERVGTRSQLFWALMGRYVVELWQGNHRLHELGRQCLALASEEGSTTLMAPALDGVARSALMRGELRSAEAHYKALLELGYDPTKHLDRRYNGGVEAGSIGLGMMGWVLWHLGYPDQAVRWCREGIARAREVGNAVSLVYVLSYLMWVRIFRRERAAAEQVNEECREVAAEAGLDGLFRGLILVGRGWTQVYGGLAPDGIDAIRTGWEDMKSKGMYIGSTTFSAWLADALGRSGLPEEGLEVLERARAAAEPVDEFLHEPYCGVVEGELYLAIPRCDPSRAEASFRHAMTLARSQESKSYELRATTSLARLLHFQGRTEEAREMLAAIYGWFTEGFDTLDLIEAKALLAELGGPAVAPETH